MKIVSFIAGLSGLILYCVACQVKQTKTPTVAVDSLVTDSAIAQVDTASLDCIQKIGDGRYAIQISFFTGPLMSILNLQP